jgi:Bacterial Ig domain/Calx-beta domain
MKKINRLFRSNFLPYLAVLLLLNFAYISFAQTTTMPVVTVRAPDPLATWSGDPGLFTFLRDGPTNAELHVFYFIGGTASNGVDYAAIGNYVTIPAGIREGAVPIKPINNGQTNAETVVLTLSQPPTLPPINYNIGNPSNATVYIVSTNRTSTNNFPPLVRIISPTNGAVFYTPLDLLICADARDPDGYVNTVEFFAGTNSLGIRTNCLPCANPQNPFCLVWSNVPPGDYLLSAKATDNDGASSHSDFVKISVLQGPPPPPPTNFPPVVRITSPPNGAMFRAPVNIPIFAYANDRDGFVTSVEFFAGTNSLGLGNQLPCRTNSTGSWECPTNLYVLVWTNAPLGTYALRAKATDNSGLTSVSEPVTVSILPPPPPPTNFTPIVIILATDPIAIEGTNCWTWPGCTNATPTWSGWPGTICRTFTNCGPKNATFVVRRFGSTNDALTVNYRIGGTASNGVDYVTLPGSVTIGAGERSAQISIVPIDDGPPDISSTVVLKLLPATNYFVGFPGGAAALIIDGPIPWPITGMLADHSFHLQAPAPDGAWFHIDYSTDMTSWTTICTNQVVNGSIDFVDPDAQSDQVRFYRAVPDDNPSPQ